MNKYKYKKPRDCGGIVRRHGRLATAVMDDGDSRGRLSVAMGSEGTADGSWLDRTISSLSGRGTPSQARFLGRVATACDHMGISCLHARGPRPADRSAAGLHQQPMELLEQLPEGPRTAGHAGREGQDRVKAGWWMRRPIDFMADQVCDTSLAIGDRLDIHPTWERALSSGDIRAHQLSTERRRREGREEPRLVLPIRDHDTDREVRRDHGSGPSEQAGARVRRTILVGIEKDEDDALGLTKHRQMDVVLDSPPEDAVMSRPRCSPFRWHRTGPADDRPRRFGTAGTCSQLRSRIGTAVTSPRPSTIGTMTYLAMDYISLKKSSSAPIVDGSSSVQRALERSNWPTVRGGSRFARTLSPRW